MPKYNHEDLESVLNFIYRKGTITAVDPENDVADVDVFGGTSGSDVPLYYHCLPDSELRSNGAIMGAAVAFSVDDEVIVMCDTSGSAVRIVGFVEGIKACCLFKFALTGSDAEVLDTGVIFAAYNDMQTPVPVKDIAYDEDGEFWHFSLDLSQEGVDCSKEFWIKYFKGGYKTTQYHSINTAEGFFQEGDRIVLGDGTLYEDIMELLEGETGYWEDWKDNLICGYREYTCYVYTETEYDPSGAPWSGTTCPTLPLNATGDGSSASLVLSNETLSFVGITSPSPSGVSSVALLVLNYQWTGSNLKAITRFNGKLVIKFNELSDSDAGGDLSYLEGNFSLKDENGNSILFWFSESAALGTTYPRDINEHQRWVWIRDKIVLGEPLELDLSDDEYSGVLNSPIVGWYLFGMGSYGSNISFSLDYIDFPRWENWDDSDEPSLCKNHNWTLTFSREYYNCPILPAILYDSQDGEANATHNVNIVDGILSWAGSSVGINTNNYLEWWADTEEEKISGVTTLVIKYSAFCSGPYPSPDEDNNVTIDIVWNDGSCSFLMMGNESYSVDAIIPYVENEEIEVDLTPYGLTASSKIRAVYLSWNLNYNEDEIRTMSLDLDYIDFKQ